MKPGQIEAFDVVIIGAGINGCGLFRELALQGIRVLLIEREDFCAGASCAPSRLIHGGIKYLETGEFRLVAQSTLERNLLLRNAPHTVTPLPTTLPIRSWTGGIVPSLRRFLRLGGKMADRGVMVIELGLLIYDILGRRARVMPCHTLTWGRRVRRRWPHMARNVIATGRYYDAAIAQPERLGFECVQDGLAANDTCEAWTYADLQGFSDGRLVARDRFTGSERAIAAPVIVNAGGAWIDRINAALGLATHYIGGTKGSHLVLDHPALLRELNGEMVYFGTPDGRICLAYPFLGHVLVGSTDIRIDDPDAAICTDEEEAYMLRMLGDLFPAFAFGPQNVIYRYAGVRPLPASSAGDPGAISRDHLIHEDHLGHTTVLSLVGGKWTTFRGLAEEVADQVLSKLQRARRVSTRTLAIGGGRNFPKAKARAAYLALLAETHHLSKERCAALLNRYGTQADAVAAFCSAAPDTALSSLQDYTRRELDFIARHELVRCLSDILFRRTTIALEGRLNPDVTREVAHIIGPSLGWDLIESARQMRSAWHDASHNHGVAGTLQPSPETAAS
jgi:glycerol-3-phosphate dehydrogenase